METNNNYQRDNAIMYTKYVEACERRGDRVYTKRDVFDAERDGHGMIRIAVHPLVTDCEPFMFILGNELPYHADIDSPQEFDVLVIPYKGFFDRTVKYAMDIGAYTMTLEEYTKFEGDFTDCNGMSIAKYLENLDWGKFAIYDKNAIYCFKDELFFLSNFYVCDIEIDGITYHSAEAAFQAQKCIDKQERKQFAELSPGQAKKLGKTVKLREDWETVKISIMKEIVLQKFLQNPTLINKLQDTGDRAIIEGNAWRDTFWGVSHGKGENHLGIILMEIRDILNKKTDNSKE